MSKRPNLIVRLLARLVRPIVREAMSPWLPPDEEKRRNLQSAKAIWGWP